MKRIVILAVTARHIKTDLEGKHYIENDTEVAARVNAKTSVAFAMALAKNKYPNALSFEIYEPISDSDQVDRV